MYIYLWMYIYIDKYMHKYNRCKNGVQIRKDFICATGHQRAHGRPWIPLRLILRKGAAIEIEIFIDIVARHLAFVAF